jgi:hypothetical protein
LIIGVDPRSLQLFLLASGTFNSETGRQAQAAGSFLFDRLYLIAFI